MAVVIVAVVLTVGAVAGAAEMVSTALVHRVSCRTIHSPCGCQAACFACPLVYCSHKIQQDDTNACLDT